MSLRVTMDPIPQTEEGVLARDAWVRELAAVVARDDLTAEDLAQETWLRALQARVVEPVRDSGAWLATVLKNAARNVRRGEARRTSRERAVARPEREEAAGPFDLAAYEERRADLVAAIERLVPAQRDVLTARFWEGLEPREIARRNCEDPAAVRQRLQRALRALRAEVDQRSGGARAAWLLPLLADSKSRALALGGATVGTGVLGSVVLLGGLSMKKLVTVGVLVVLALVTAVAWSGEGAAEGVAPPVGVVPASDPGGSSDPAMLEGEGTAPERLDRTRVDTAGSADVALEHVLLDASGSPLGGVAYWLDEKPFQRHPGRAPEDAPRTDDSGRFDLSELTDRRGDYLWFEIEEELSIAIARDDAAAGVRLFAPRMVEMSVEVRALPQGRPWRFLGFPAWGKHGQTDDLTHGSQHVAERTDGEGRTCWIARRLAEKRGSDLPPKVTMRAVAGLPVAVYCEATGWEVEPDIIELPEPSDVVALAVRPRLTFPFQVLERDAVTPSTIGGRMLFSWPDSGSSSGQLFEGGAGEIDLSERNSRGDVYFAVVLRDGEVFGMRLDDHRLTAGGVLQLVRGTGRAASRSLEIDPTLLDDEEVDIFAEVEGRMRHASRFSWFTPIPEELGYEVGAWLFEGRLVVQVDDRASPVGRVRILTPEGRVAHSEGDRMVELPHVEMEPIVPERLLAAYAKPAGATYLMVSQEIAWPAASENDLEWLRVRTFRFLEVEDFGWRFSDDASIDSHIALPASIPTGAPAGVRARLRLRLRNHDGWIDLAHSPKR